MATKQTEDKQSEQPVDGGTVPLVQAEPELSFDERTRVTRAWEVGDDSPRDPEAAKSKLVGDTHRPDGAAERGNATPVDKKVKGKEIEDEDPGLNPMEQSTEDLKDAEETPADTDEAKNTEAAKQQKGVGSEPGEEDDKDSE